jgi:hypothetical protein
VLLDHHDKFQNYFYLSVLDRETNAVLWTVKRDKAIGV